MTHDVRDIWHDIHARYGVASISRPLKIIGLFRRISSLLWGSFAKETYNFKEPTNRSHPIWHDSHKRHDSFISLPRTSFDRKTRMMLQFYVMNDWFVWDMTHSHIWETWLIHMRDTTCSYETWLIHVRHDSFMWDMTHSCETWLIHVRHDSFMWDMTDSCETWLIHVRHDSFMWDMTHACDTTHAHACTVFMTGVSRHRVRLCDVTCSYVAHPPRSYIWMRSNVWSDAFISVTWRIHRCDVTHS